LLAFATAIGFPQLRLDAIVAFGEGQMDYKGMGGKSLTAAQTTGLRFYESSQLRIPRTEMTEHEAVLKSLIPALLNGTSVGSYRRGAADSGDSDMLVSYAPSTDVKAAQKAFQALVAALATRYVVFPLASGKTKWMGFLQTGAGVGRRLDLLLTPPEEMPYAILYFTGSDRFNVAMRKHATTLGYTMNEHTMKKVAAEAKDIPTMTKEEDIFTFLGLRYIPPTERVNHDQIIIV
jgi:DNA polymerase/3'-5' exonuclease PolX